MIQRWSVASGDATFLWMYPDGGAYEPEAATRGMNTVNSKKVGEVLVVELQGRIDATCADGVEQQLLDLLTDDDHKMVVGLDQVHHIDSSGLGVLLAALKRARPLGGDVRLYGVSAPLEPVFRITGMRRVFKIFDDEASAVQSF